MDSSAFDTFTCFPDFPVELQKTVWEQAAADLPVLDIQRFTAGFALGPRSNDPDTQLRPVLCFTPHADFITLTAGHRGLMGACTESRKAALPQISCLLPIQYLTTDATGITVPRQAFVPFNTAGYFCISGLGRAVSDATLEFQARRSVKFCPWNDPLLCLESALREVKPSQIKNLMIALDPPSHDNLKHDDMRGKDPLIFEDYIWPMRSLEKVSLIGEGVVNRRHHIDPHDFDMLLQTQDVSRLGPDYVDWYQLWIQLDGYQIGFYKATREKILGLDQFVRGYPVGFCNSDYIVELEARRRELVETLAVIMH